MMGCGQSGSTGGGGVVQDFDPDMPSGVVSFEISMISTGEFKRIIALGNLNPAEHTLPTDHINFVHDKEFGQAVVYAPASGKVLDIYTFNYGSKYDHRIKIGVTNSYTYIFYHVILDTGIKVGDAVSYGQRLGVLSDQVSTLGLGLLNKNAVNSFIDSGRYASSFIHGDSPLKYFKEPARSQLYAKVDRNGSDKDGVFCYDKPGNLVGNWFWESAPVTQTTAVTECGTMEIAFVYDVTRPESVAISIGGTIFDAGVYYVSSEATDPAKVTTSNEKVTYKLYQDYGCLVRKGILIAQMITDSKISLEASSDTTLETIGFTSTAKNYTR